MTSTASELLVSVVMPAYNVAWCIGRAVDSVLAQDFHQRELIVVNDGSTDGARALLETYRGAIKVIDQDNRGMSAARNAGIRSALGTYVAFLDADDWWLPQKLSRQVQLMQSRPEIGFCSTAARVEDGDGRLLNLWRCPNGSTEILATLFAQNAAIAGGCSAVIVRKELFDRVGLFDETLRGFEDPDLWMRLAAVSGYACIGASAATWTPCGSPHCGRCARTGRSCHRGCAAASGATASPASIPTMQNPRTGPAGSAWPTRTRYAPSCSPPWDVAGSASGSCGISC